MTDAASNITTDLAKTCFTCEPLKEYVALSSTYADKLSEALSGPMLILFSSFLGLWMVVVAYKMLFAQADIKNFIQDLVYITITGVILGSQANPLISFVYNTSLSIMSGAADTAFSVVGGADKAAGYQGLVRLAANGEFAVTKVIQAATAISMAGSWYEMMNYVYALILVIPYFILIAAYASQVVVAIFRAILIAIFAPFLFMAFAFNWGRPMAFSGAKTLLAAILVLFACTAALALTIYGVSQIAVDPKALTGEAAKEFASMSNPRFLVILFLGWMGMALMTEGTSIANSIAGTALTNTAAGLMTAGISASAGAAMSSAGNLASGNTFADIRDSATRGLHGWRSVGGGIGAVGGGVAGLLHRREHINDDLKGGGSSAS